MLIYDRRVFLYLPFYTFPFLDSPDRNPVTVNCAMRENMPERELLDRPILPFDGSTYLGYLALVSNFAVAIDIDIADS